MASIDELLMQPCGKAKASCHIPAGEKVENFCKNNSIMGSPKKSNDSITIPEKQGHKDHEIKCCEAGEFSEKDKKPNDDVFIGEADNASSRNPQSFVPLNARNSAEATSGLTSISSENAPSSVLLDGNFKNSEVSTQSSDGVASSLHHTPLKSDISSEIGLPFNRRTIRRDAGQIYGYQPDGHEDSYKSRINNSQCKAESSCSSSANAMRPVHVLSDSCQELLSETKSPRNHIVHANSSGPVSKCSPEEAVTCTITWGAAAHVSQKSADDVRAKDRIQVALTMGDQKPFDAENLDISVSSLQNPKSRSIMEQAKEEPLICSETNWPWKFSKETRLDTGPYVQTSESTSSSCEKRKNNMVCGNSVFCTNSNRFQSRNGQNDKSFCFRNEVCNNETATNRVMNDLSDGFCKLDSSKSKSLTLENNGAKDQTASMLDLNENIQKDSIDDENLLQCGIASSFDVIHVAARPATPTCSPILPLQFEGELGWKGAAATSAFYPASAPRSFEGYNISSNENSCTSNHLQRSAVFDLNIAAEEDNTAPCFVPERANVSSASQEVFLKPRKVLGIDLNCSIDNAEENCQPLPVRSPKQASLNLDLNESPSSGVASDSVHWQCESSQHVGKGPSENTMFLFTANSKQPDHLSQQIYPAESNFMPVSDHAHPLSFFVARPNLPPVQQVQGNLPLNPKLPYMQTLPLSSYAYPSNVPFYICPAGAAYPGIHYPGAQYARKTQENTIVPQMLNPGMVPAFSRVPLFAEAAHARTCSDMNNTTSNFVTGSVEISEANGKRRENVRQFIVSPQNSLVEAQMKSCYQESYPVTPMKRREPDGGWDSHQLGYRNVAPWQ